MSRDEIQRINFKLETLKKENELEYIIARRKIRAFTIMRRMNTRRIEKRIKASETRFTILLELNPEQHGADEAEVAQGSASAGNY